MGYKPTNIIAQSQTQTIKLSLSQWQFFRRGQNKLVYKNTNSHSKFYGKVIIVSNCIIRNQKIQELIYQQFIKHILDLNRILLQREKLSVSGIDNIVAFLQYFSIIEHSTTQLPKMIEFYLAQDLSFCQNQDNNIILQLKPKSPFPDIYSLSFIQEFAPKFQMKTKELAQLLQIRGNQNRVQRLRWFKKNCLSGNYKHQNPFQLFGLQNQSDFQISIKKNIFRNQKIRNNEINKHMRKNSNSTQGIIQNQQKYWNKIKREIFKELQNTEYFRKILVLQSMYIGALSNVEGIKDCYQNDRYDKETYNECVMSLLLEFKNRQKQLNEIGIKEYIKNSLKKNIIQQNINEQKVDNLIKLKFLISATWRDISLIIKCKFNKYQQNIILETLHTTIIDYDLKQNQKVINANLNKDHQYLQNYILYCLSL